MDIRRTILEQASKLDSFYVYSEQGIDDQIEKLTADFQSIEFLYSIKTNTASEVLKTIFSHGFGADAASLGEVKLAHGFGVPADKIQYSAPGKKTSDIEAAMGISTIIADSVAEIYQIQALAAAKNSTAEIGIRINPDFTLSSGTGAPSKFGIDAQEALRFLRARPSLPHVRVIGIHVHIKSQELCAQTLEGYYANLFRLACAFEDALGGALQFVNMGSGMGIPCASGDTALDTAALGRRTAQLMAEYKEKLHGVRIIIETGRFVVGQSGYYATRVMDRKTSMGRTYIILNGTLNAFMRPCLARLVAHYAPDGELGGSEPLFSGRDAFAFVALNDEPETELVTLAGNLCTAADVVAEDIELPKLKRGDLLMMTNAGCYGAVLSPMQFSSQKPPAQLFLCRDGAVINAVKP